MNTLTALHNRCIRCKHNNCHYDSRKWPLICTVCKSEVIKLHTFTKINNILSMTKTRVCMLPGCDQRVGYNISDFCPHHDLNHYYSTEHTNELECITNLFIKASTHTRMNTVHDPKVEPLLHILPIKYKIYNHVSIYYEILNVYVLQMMSNNLYTMVSITSHHIPDACYGRGIYKCIKVTDNIYRFDPTTLDILINDSPLFKYYGDDTYFKYVPADIINMLYRMIF